ncbi:MAG: phosphatidylglycerophosphatase A [Spirochaetes bacterium]|nr:MAG: phosphatidylglycerophosphatase A [Spirochaetota bacterium]
MWWKEILFTGAYSGYFPFASGTAGTLVALALCVLEHLLFGQVSWIINTAVIAALLYPCVRLCGAGEAFLGVKDPAEVVLDEIMGFKIALLCHSFCWKTALAAFLLFRIFDILKPFPAKRLQELDGGIGIVVDDIIAGIYTNITILVALRLIPEWILR